MKKFPIVIISSALVVVLGATLLLPNKNSYMDKLNKIQTGSATWEYGAQTVDELTDYSDLIVEGKVVDYKPVEDGNLIFTYETVEIKKVIKGDISKGDSITVVVTGGELNGKITNPIEDCPIMDLRLPYMLFLEKTDSGDYAIVAGNQGFGKINNNKIDFVGDDTLAKELKNYNEDSLSKHIKNEIEK